MSSLRPVAAIAASLCLLTGCSADDTTGVTLSDSGSPVVTNCGTWISGVSVFDDETDILLWSAAAARSAGDESEATVGDVEIGVLPNLAWHENVVFDPSLAAGRWRFEVDTGDPDRTVIIADAKDLRPDAVYLLDATRVSREVFIDDVCGYAPSQNGRRSAVIAAALIVTILGATFVTERHRRRRLRLLHP